MIRAAIKKRGETPHPLRSEPRGSELASKSQKGSDVKVPDPDPSGKLDRDDKNLVQSVDVMLTPQPVRPGDRVRVRVSFTLDPKKKVKSLF